MSVRRVAILAQPRLLLPGALAALAAAALNLLYIAIIRGQNPADLHQPRVLFVITFTAAIAVSAATGTVTPIRWARVLLLSLAAWGSLIFTFVAMLSIGILYIVPLALLLVALTRTLQQELRWTDIALSGGTFLFAVLAMVEGFQHYPLA
jgi:hypothetical protein